MYKLFVFAPNKEDLINLLIETASQAGAGVIGNYSCCAFVTSGMGNWKSEEGSNPTIGEIGKISHEPEVRIEMICPKEKASAVRKAIKAIHLYEEPEIDFVELINVD